MTARLLRAQKRRHIKIFSCPCHKIDRVEEVGLSVSSGTLKVTISEYKKIEAVS